MFTIRLGRCIYEVTSTYARTMLIHDLEDSRLWYALFGYHALLIFYFLHLLTTELLLILEIMSRPLLFYLRHDWAILICWAICFSCSPIFSIKIIYLCDVSLSLMHSLYVISHWVLVFVALVWADLWHVDKFCAILCWWYWEMLEHWE